MFKYLLLLATVTFSSAALAEQPSCVASEDGSGGVQITQCSDGTVTLVYYQDVQICRPVDNQSGKTVCTYFSMSKLNKK